MICICGTHFDLDKTRKKTKKSLEFTEVEIMRKIIATFVMMAMLAIAVPLTVDAQTRRTYKKPNVYQRHRNLINIGIGTAAGAIIGGLVGGKKGALIGAGVGAGGGAAYTYGIKPKKKRYYRYRRN